MLQISIFLSICSHLKGGYAFFTCESVDVNGAGMPKRVKEREMGYNSPLTREVFHTFYLL